MEGSESGTAISTVVNRELPTSQPNQSLLYLSESDVKHLLPPIAVQVELVAEAYASIASGSAQVPAVPVVQPRPGAFLHAMPTYLGDRDVTALKWIGGYSGNPARGLPYLSGLVLVNDSTTGLVRAVMDAGAITAARTAAASGLCIREFAPKGWRRAAIIGYGIQAAAHEAVLRHFNPHLELRVATLPPIPDGLEKRTRLTAIARDAVEGADIVVTGIPLDAQLTPPVSADWLGEKTLVLPIDYDASLAPDVSHSAGLFCVDEVAGYELKRQNGRFAGWREPDSSVGAAMSPVGSRIDGPILCCNLGVGALDAIFADVLLKAAVQAGRGTRLPR
jgi:ornithine cyclodeaminase/alanine dehydrogenase-like protein (mu-crystallin family)